MDFASKYVEVMVHMSKTMPISKAATRKQVRRGNFVAEINADGENFRFVIRDENREKPSIHGAKNTLHETEAEIDAVLDRLCPEQRAA